MDKQTRDMIYQGGKRSFLNRDFINRSTFANISINEGRSASGKKSPVGELQAVLLNSSQTVSRYLDSDNAAQVKKGMEMAEAMKGLLDMFSIQMQTNITKGGEKAKTMRTAAAEDRLMDRGE